MAHLGNIQQLLNSDANYRSRFLKDPVAALAEQGLILSFEMQTQLRKMVAQVQTASGRTPGAALGPGGLGQRALFTDGGKGLPILGDGGHRALPVLGDGGHRALPLIIAFD